MFTGIIEEIGKIKEISGNGSSRVLVIETKKVLKDTKIGDSIAVNGVCLTVTGLGDNYFTADVMAETVRRSSLSQLVRGSQVNLERAMAADGRFGGHIVSGHVDATGEILDILPEENAIWYTVGTKPTTLHYIVEKGSITIDGISLTVAYVDETCFKVSIIPPNDFVGSLMDLCQTKRGIFINMHYIDDIRVNIEYQVPLSESPS